MVAFDVMRNYPRIVRSVAISDPIPPGLDPDFSAVTNLSAALQRYAALCAAEQRCHEAFPDIIGAFQRDYLQFQQHPVTVKVSVQPGTVPIPVLVDGQSGATALAGALAGPGMPVVASEIYAPNPALVATAAVTYAVGSVDLTWGALASYDCKDVLPGIPSNVRLEEQADALADPQLAGVDASAQLDIRLCQAWKVGPEGPNAFTPIVSDIPTFLFGGALDPYESSTWYTKIAQGLSHAVVVTFPTLNISSLRNRPHLLVTAATRVLPPSDGSP